MAKKRKIWCVEIHHANGGMMSWSQWSYRKPVINGAVVTITTHEGLKKTFTNCCAVIEEKYIAED